MFQLLRVKPLRQRSIKKHQWGSSTLWKKNYFPRFDNWIKECHGFWWYNELVQPILCYPDAFVRLICPHILHVFFSISIHKFPQYWFIICMFFLFLVSSLKVTDTTWKIVRSTMPFHELTCFHFVSFPHFQFWLNRTKHSWDNLFKVIFEYCRYFTMLCKSFYSF